MKHPCENVGLPSCFKLAKKDEKPLKRESSESTKDQE